MTLIGVGVLQLEILEFGNLNTSATHKIFRITIIGFYYCVEYTQLTGFFKDTLKKMYLKQTFQND